MKSDTTTLLMSSRNTADNQLIWRAAVQRGWSVERVRGLRSPDLEPGRIVIYMESLFAPSIAKEFGLQLVQLPDDWLQSLPDEYRLRSVTLTTLGQISQSTLPLFLKPPNEKAFPAKIYHQVEPLLEDYDSATPVLAASPIEWESEYRCFCLGRQVRTSSIYLRRGELCESATEEELIAAQAFAKRVLRDKRVRIPQAFVLDVGIIVGHGWAVVEANAAWGSGIYGCDPDEVLRVLEQATIGSYERPND